MEAFLSGSRTSSGVGSWGLSGNMMILPETKLPAISSATDQSDSDDREEVSSDS